MYQRGRQTFHANTDAGKQHTKVIQGQIKQLQALLASVPEDATVSSELTAEPELFIIEDTPAPESTREQANKRAGVPQEPAPPTMI